MENEIKLFGITRAQIKNRLERLQESQQLKAVDLYGIHEDGDASDDPLVKDMRGEQDLLQQEIKNLTALLATGDHDIIKVPVGENITLGHKVSVKIKSDDGIEDVFTVTIGSTYDKQCLDSTDTYHRFFDKDTNLLISQDSPLGRSLLGKEKGNSFHYKVGNLEYKGRIVNVEISPIITES